MAAPRGGQRLYHSLPPQRQNKIQETSNPFQLTSQTPTTSPTMGMNFTAILDNNWSRKDLLNLPKKINGATSLSDIYSTYHPNSFTNNSQKQAVWSGSYPMTINNLETIWRYYKEDREFSPGEHINYDASIDTYFGEITVNKSTFTVSLFPEHKYRNLRTPAVSKYIFTMIRELAKLLGSERIVYCCDSYFLPSILEEKAFEGSTLDDVIEFGNLHFGTPPKEINAAIENLYFIDEFDLSPVEINPEKAVWSRSQFEHEINEEGGHPYESLKNYYS